MKILYITELWNGFEDLICSGKSEASGMPSFIYPLQEMIIKRGFLIDFAIVASDPKELNIKASWLKNSNYYWVNNRSFLKVFVLYKIIKKGNYDFIYGHGGGGGWGNFAAILARKPFGMRYYGTFLGQCLDDNYFSFFRRNLLKSLVYNLPKKFMLVTNDGTKGDLVYEKLCIFKKAYAFKFWLNGVEKSGSQELDENLTLQIFKSIFESNAKVLLYPARYDPWKRQHLALELLRAMKKTVNENFVLLFCGHKYDNKYFNELVNLAAQYNIEDCVVFADPVEPDVLSQLMQRAYAVLSMYDFSNLGNVMIEAAQKGSFIVTIKDGSTDFLIENEKTGISIPYSPTFASQLADKLGYYSRKREIVELIKRNLQERADKLFLTWEHRTQKEIELIESSVN